MKKLLLLIPIALLVFIFLYVSGYRFTAKSAAEAHSFLKNDSTLIQKVESNFGELFVYKTEDYYITIVPEKIGLLFRASSSITTQDINDKSDKVRTIGWASGLYSDKSGTIMVIEVQDVNIAYIEAGSELQRIRKNVIKGENLILEWDKGHFVHEINAIAYSEKGEKLYFYGYDPATPNFIDQKELRWRKVQ